MASNTFQPIKSIGRRRGVGSKPLVTLLLWLSAILAAFPFYWMVRSSVMLEKQIMRFPPIWIPSSPTLQNFADVLTKQPFGRYIVNSLLVALVVTLGQLIVASMGAYAFARLRFPGRDRIFLVYLATMIIPTQVTLIPQYVLDQPVWLGQQLRRADCALSLQCPPHLSLAAVLPLHPARPGGLGAHRWRGVLSHLRHDRHSLVRPGAGHQRPAGLHGELDRTSSGR